MNDGDSRTLRILLVDDQDMVRDALRSLVESTLDYEVAGAASASEAVSIVERQEIDLVLLDVKMPDVDGIETLRRLRRIAPELPIVMLSSYDELRDVRDALDEGARGYIIKGATSHQLKEAIDVALSGNGVYVHPLVAEHMLPGRRGPSPREVLSEREIVVLACLCEGATNDQIARTLSVSLKTVKSQLSSVFRKLGVSNRTEAVAKALREGLVAEPRSRRGSEHHSS